MENTEEVKTTGQVSKKKLPIVESASFATIIQAIKNKTEKAQRTFLLQLAESLNDEELASMNVISQKQIKLRAIHGNTKPHSIVGFTERMQDKYPTKEGKTYAAPTGVQTTGEQYLAGNFSAGGGI